MTLARVAGLGRVAGLARVAGFGLCGWFGPWRRWWRRRRRSDVVPRKAEIRVRKFVSRRSLPHPAPSEDRVQHPGNRERADGSGAVAHPGDVTFLAERLLSMLSRVCGVS